MLAEHAGLHVEMVRKSHPSTYLNLCEPLRITGPDSLRNQVFRHDGVVLKALAAAWLLWKSVMPTPARRRRRPHQDFQDKDIYLYYIYIYMSVIFIEINQLTHLHVYLKILIDCS